MYLYLLVRAVDHGDEHVEENDDHCDIIDAVQYVADVLDEFMVVLKHHRDHFRQPEYGPEEGLEALLHSARNERENVMMKKKNRKQYLTMNTHCPAYCSVTPSAAHQHTKYTFMLWGL